MPFLASEPLTDKIVWDNGNKYTYRLRASTFMQTAMLVPEAAKLGKKRWAIVYPNYEYGQSATAAFKKQMNVLQSGGLEFVEQAVPLGKIDPGPVVQALHRRAARRDLLVAVRPRPRALRARRPAARTLQGPAGVQPAGRRAGVSRSAEGRSAGGLVRHGLPVVRHRARPSTRNSSKAYQAKFNDYPRLGSVVGYSAVIAAAAALKKAGSTDAEKIVAALSGLTFVSPFGSVTFRPIDHQSTMGAYVGRTAVKDGKGVMVDWKYADGKDYQPTDAVVRTLRPQ